MEDFQGEIIFSSAMAKSIEFWFMVIFYLSNFFGGLQAENVNCMIVNCCS